MLNEKTIKELISIPSFLSNASKLAYMLHMSNEDASQTLLLELLDHRLRKWTNDDLTLAIQRDLPSLKWRIKYARKDIVRQSNKDANRELEKAQMMAGMEAQASSNESETLEALKRLPDLFKNANTRDWAESVLRVGKSETTVRFNQTPRQFNSKLAKVCKYSRQRQKNRLIKDNSKELKVLKEWDELMANPDTTDNDIQAFIDQHRQYIDNIIDDPKVAFQGRLIKSFKQAGKDKYTFANLMTAREQELKESK